MSNERICKYKLRHFKVDKRLEYMKMCEATLVTDSVDFDGAARSVTEDNGLSRHKETLESKKLYNIQAN